MGGQAERSGHRRSWEASVHASAPQALANDKEPSEGGARVTGDFDSLAFEMGSGDSPRGGGEAVLVSPSWRGVGAAFSPLGAGLLGPDSHLRSRATAGLPGRQGSVLKCETRDL